MTEEDVRAVVRALKQSQASEFEGLHARLDEVETGLINGLREVSRRVEKVEKGLGRVEQRLGRVEDQLEEHVSAHAG